MRRAQLFSVDFLVALVILGVILALFVHSYEFSQRNPLERNRAVMVAEAVFSGFPLPFPVCVEYSNGTASPACFQSCVAGDVHVARRLVPCPQGACSMSVKVCG